MCYTVCKYQNSFTGECNNPSKYSKCEDAACYEAEEQEEVKKVACFYNRGLCTKCRKDKKGRA